MSRPKTPVVVILCSHPFPHGNASANRVLTLAQTFVAAGHSVQIVNDFDEMASEGTRTGAAAGIPFVSLEYPGGGRLERSARRRSFGERAFTSLDDAGRIALVVVPSILFTPRLVRLVRRVAPQAQLVVDIVERFDKSQFQWRSLDPYFVRHRVTSAFAIREADHVIVVSSALAMGPCAGRQTLILPPAVDCDAIAPPGAGWHREANHVEVLYTGSPGSKDDLGTVVEALATLPSTVRDRLRFTIAGVTGEQLVRLPGVSSASLHALGERVQAVGQVSRDEALSLLGRADFSILVRDPAAGVARHGFPSKIPESLAAGCPPILNLTSDLGRYLRNGHDCIVLSGNSATDVEEGLRRVATLDPRASSAMRLRARETAEQTLTPAVWADRLSSYLSRTVDGRRRR